MEIFRKYPCMNVFIEPQNLDLIIGFDYILVAGGKHLIYRIIQRKVGDFRENFRIIQSLAYNNSELLHSMRIKCDGNSKKYGHPYIYLHFCSPDFLQKNIPILETLISYKNFLRGRICLKLYHFFLNILDTHDDMLDLLGEVAQFINFNTFPDLRYAIKKYNESPRTSEDLLISFLKNNTTHPDMGYLALLNLFSKIENLSTFKDIVTNSFNIMQISKDETSAPMSHFFYFLDQAKEHFLSFGCDREFLETVIQRLRCSKIDQASPDGIYRLLTLDFSDNDAEFQKLIFYTGYILSGIIVKSIRYAVLVSRHNLDREDLDFNFAPTLQDTHVDIVGYALVLLYIIQLKTTGYLEFYLHKVEVSAFKLIKHFFVMRDLLENFKSLVACEETPKTLISFRKNIETLIVFMTSPFRKIYD